MLLFFYYRHTYLQWVKFLILFSKRKYEQISERNCQTHLDFLMLLQFLSNSWNILRYCQGLGCWIMFNLRLNLSLKIKLALELSVSEWRVEYHFKAGIQKKTNLDGNRIYDVWKESWVSITTGAGHVGDFRQGQGNSEQLIHLLRCKMASNEKNVNKVDELAKSREWVWWGRINVTGESISGWGKGQDEDYCCLYLHAHPQEC